MRSIALVGVNALDETVKLGKDVTQFTDEKHYFSVKFTDDGDPKNRTIELVTPKGSYQLNKHSVNNIYMGVCSGRRVHVSLKKVVGELRFW